MKVLLDTNVVLDVLLERQPWVRTSSAIWAACDQELLTGFISAAALTDVFYIARRVSGPQVAHRAVGVCLKAFDICPVTRETLEWALACPGNDFEDNVQVACAVLTDLDAVVTRDSGGFDSPPLPILSPAELLAQLGLSL